MLDTIIIIPYRAREKHLKYFLDHTVPLLKKHIPNGKVVVVEQDWNNKLFNRGCLLNIGVKEYENKTLHLITHDVDINPLEKTILKYYTPNIAANYVLGILTSCHDTLAPIVKFNMKSFFYINGFPNDIWGWGAEDIALQERAKYYKLNIQKNLINTRKTDDNFIHFNDVDDRIRNYNDININKYNLSNKSDDVKKYLIKNSGLNNLQYKIIARRQLNDYVEFIKVSI